MDIILTHSVPMWNLPAHNARCLEALIYLELCNASYERRVCTYTINPMAEDSELPLARVGEKTVIGECSGGIVDMLEGTKSSSSSDPSIKTTKLNDCLSPSEKADLATLQELVRDRLHLVTLHQLYANEENWAAYSIEMSAHLPLCVRHWYMQKERKLALKQLHKYQITTPKYAMDLLKDCLDTLTIKYPPCNMDQEPDDEENENEDDEKKEEVTKTIVSYFFGDNRPTSFDAVIVSELVALNCCKLPNNYMKDGSIVNNQKYQKLFQYVQQVFTHHCHSMESKLKTDKFNHAIHPGQQTRRIPSPSISRKFNSTYSGLWKWFTSAEKHDSAKLSDDTQTSLLFLLGSVTAVAIYWKCFQPVVGVNKNPK